MDAHRVGHKVPTVITADSLIAGASSGSPGHKTGGLPASSALASAPTMYQGVVIKRLECTQLSGSPPVSDSPVGTVTGRCSSTSSCSGDGGSSSNTGLETAADGTHLCHNRQQQGSHAAGIDAGGRPQQAHTDASQQQQQQQQQGEVALARAHSAMPILPLPGLQLPRPPLPAGSSKGPVPDLNNPQPSCYIQRRRMLAQARQRMHATAPERLVGLALPPATYTATNFNQLVTHAGDAAAPAAAAAAAGTSVAATGGRDASRAEEDRDGASPRRKRRAYNTRCKTPKPAAAAASSVPAPAAPVPVRKGRRAATPRPSPPAAAAAAAAAVPGPAAAAALGVSQQPQRQAAPPVALPAPASAPVGLGAMGSVYADMEPPALAMSGTIIKAAALVSPPTPSPVTAAGAAPGAAAGAGMDVAAGPYQPMDMCSSGAACFTSQEPSILALGGDVLALGVYEPVTGAWGDTGGHSQQCLGHQLPALATWDCLPSAAAAAAAGGGGTARLSAPAPAAAAAARGPAAAPMGRVEQLGGSLTGWDSGAGAAPQQLPAQALQRNSSSLSSSSALWLDKDPSPRPDNTHLPSLSPPPFFAAAAAAGVGARPAGASWYAPAGLLCGIAMENSSSRPVVDVSGVMSTVWGEDDEGSLDAVLDMLAEGGVEEVGSGAGHTWLEGWEQELLL